jgi:hypothetical protein
MSTNTVTSFSGLSKPAEYINLEASWLSAPWSEAEPSNNYADDPRAAAFGKSPASDWRFSAEEEVSRVILHLPDNYGRATGAKKASTDEFYRLSPYSDGGGRQFYRTSLPVC